MLQTSVYGPTGTQSPTSTPLNLFQKNKGNPKKVCFCFIDYAKAFDCVDHNKLWKILKVTGIPDHSTWLLGNLYASEEATVQTRYGTTNWLKIGKGVYYHPAYLTDMQSVSYGGWCQVRGIQRKFHSGTKDRVSVIESFVKQIIY